MPAKFHVVETWVARTAAHTYGRCPNRTIIQKAMALTTRPVAPTAPKPTARRTFGEPSVDSRSRRRW